MLQSHRDQDLLDAIRKAQGPGSFVTVTVLVPNLTSALQTRRRVARLAGSLFNVRWLDLRQLTAEIAGGMRQPTGSQQLAAAWKAVQGSQFESLVGPKGSVHIFRSIFQEIDQLNEESRSVLSADLLAAFHRFQAALEKFALPSTLLAAVLNLADQIPTPLVIAGVRGQSENERMLLEVLKPQASAVIEAEDGSVPSCQGWEVYDSESEYSLLSHFIRHAGLEGIPMWEMGVVVPPGARTLALLSTAFDNAGIEWNGDLRHRLKETEDVRAFVPPAGPFGGWAEAADRYEAMLTSDPAKQGVLEWHGVGELGIPFSERLLGELWADIEERLEPRQRRFGDGVFVGSLDQFEGLTFQRLFVVGFRDGAYPKPRARLPLLPRHVVGDTSEGQFETLKRALAAAESADLIWSIADRTGRREQFPSRWLDRLPVTTTSMASPLAVEESFGFVSKYSLSNIEMPAGDDVKVGKNLFLAEKEYGPSELETYASCPRKWFYRYQLGLREPDPVITFGFDKAKFGSIVHAYLKQQVESGAEPPSEEAALTSLLELAGPEAERASARNLFRQVATRLCAYLADDVATRGDRKPTQFEATVKGELAGMRITGRVDRIDTLGSGGALVIDYKTGKRKATRDIFNMGERLQGLLYSMLIGGEVQWEYVYFGEDKTKTITGQVNEEATETGLAWVTAIREGMEEGVIAMIPQKGRDEACPYCSYRNVCVANRLEVAASQRAQARGAFAKLLTLKGIGPEEEEGDDE